MPSFIQPIITDAGLAAAIAANGQGLQLEITHIQLGTGAYVLDPTIGSADYARTALVAPTETMAVAGGFGYDYRFRVDVLFPSWEAAPYSVMEVGFWAGDPNAGGILFAVWSHLAPIAQRNLLDYLATYNLTLARVPYGSVTVQVDPDLSWALSLIGDHEAALDPHTQYLKKTGGHLPKIGLTGGTLVLTEAELAHISVITFNGALTSNLTVHMPVLYERVFTLRNATSGAFSVTVKTPLGANLIELQPLERKPIFCNGDELHDALYSLNLLGAPRAPTPAQFDTSTLIATMEAVRRYLGNWRSQEASGATKTIGPADIGKIFQLNGGAVVTIPTGLSIGAKEGDAVSFYNLSNTPATLVPGAGCALNYGSSAVNPITVKAGQCVTLVRSGNAVWAAVNSTAMLGENSDFALLAANNGWQKLPSGLIIQWGRMVSDSSGFVSVTYPLTFPEVVYSLLVTDNAVGVSTLHGWGATFDTLSGFDAFSGNLDNGVGALSNGRWLAIGK